MTISEAAARSGISAHTLRYYDREGLLPFVERSATGNRIFTDDDLPRLQLICELKRIDMPLRQIRDFMVWYLSGDNTVCTRLHTLRQHREQLKQQMEALAQRIERIDRAIDVHQQKATTVCARSHRRTA